MTSSFPSHFVYKQKEPAHWPQFVSSTLKSIRKAWKYLFLGNLVLLEHLLKRRSLPSFSVYILLFCLFYLLDCLFCLHLAWFLSFDTWPCSAVKTSLQPTVHRLGPQVFRSRWRPLCQVCSHVFWIFVVICFCQCFWIDNVYIDLVLISIQVGGLIVQKILDV